jgi:hypothetical protein
MYNQSTGHHAYNLLRAHIKHKRCHNRQYHLTIGKLKAVISSRNPRLGARLLRSNSKNKYWRATSFKLTSIK